MIRTVLCLGLLFVSCRNREAPSTPTSGELKLICDDAVSSVVEAQKSEFLKNYPLSKISMTYASASAAIVKLINNDIEFIISSRELDTTETEFLIRNDIKVYSQKFALDGIAILVNSENPLTELSMGHLEAILSGTMLSWREISDTLRFPPSVRQINVLSDGRRSGNYALLRHLLFSKENHLSKDAVIITGDSLQSAAPKLLEALSEDPSSITYVSTSWLGNNPEYLKYSEKIRILKIASDDLHKAVDPIPGYVYRGDYPLRRMLFIMHRQTYTGLAAGFTAYITGNEGQKICLANNIVPGMNPIRLKRD